MKKKDRKEDTSESNDKLIRRMKTIPILLKDQLSKYKFMDRSKIII